MFEIDPTVLQLLISTVIPLLVGVTTKKASSSGVKAIALALLAAVAAVATAALQAGGVVASDVIIESFQNFVVAVAVYYGVWKPTGTAEAVQDKTSGFGVTIKEEKTA